ncbi:MAG: sodium:proton antiporter [Acetivibrionales bacterium]|jgi:multicomponent Na+:H+ antiporter subunit C|nr:cation:proton antiporter subunit C [Clostridiaceae bacterium]
MSILIKKLIINYPYFAAFIIFSIGALTVLKRSNLFKKLIGINIMESAIFLMFVASGNIRGGAVPISNNNNPQSLYINPLPSALMLTGIVVSVSVTAFALALILRLYRSYGTTDLRRISEMGNEVAE